MAEALLVIDVQNDFCPGGALAVPGGDEIVDVCNDWMARHEHVVLTQDCHPRHHASFASSHPGKSPYDTAELAYGTQVLWPDHCVQGTPGADFHPSLDRDRATLIVRKGWRRAIDSYSAFYENDRATPTGLSGALRTLGVDRVVLLGLATDFCVQYSALDAVREGFRVAVVEAGCRGIDLDGSVSAAWSAMLAVGVERL